MNNRKITNLVLILIFVFLGMLLLKNTFSYLDPDLGWHLKAGQDFIEKKEITTTNFYNYTLADKPWIDHEWLFDVFLYWFYNNSNYFTLALFFTILGLSVFYLLLKRSFTKIPPNKYSTSSILFFSVILLCLGVASIVGHIGVRMQIISWLFLLLELIILERYFSNKKIKVLWWLLPLLLFWANLHGSFLLGLFIIFFAGGIKTVEKIIYKYKSKFKFVNFSKVLSNKQIWYIYLFALGAIVVTFINPYGIQLYSFLSGYTNTFYLTHIQEWLPLYYLPLLYFKLFFVLFTASFLILDIWKKIQDKRGINLWKHVLVLVFTLLAIKSVRHVPLLLVVAFDFWLLFCLENFTFNKTTKRKLSKTTRNIIIVFLMAVYIVSVSNVLLDTKFVVSKPFTKYCESKYPCEAVDFLKKHHEEYKNLNMFNEFNWGGYLIWNYPERKLFVDGRQPQAQYKDHTILQEYLEFKQVDQDKIKSKIDEYNIELFLIDKHKEKLKLDVIEKFLAKDNFKAKPEYKLKNYLETQANWEKVFVGKTAIIYKYK